VAEIVERVEQQVAVGDIDRAVGELQMLDP